MSVLVSCLLNTSDLAANSSKDQTPRHSTTPCPVVFSCFIKVSLFSDFTFWSFGSPRLFCHFSSQPTADNKKLGFLKKGHNVIHTLIIFLILFLFCFFSWHLEKTIAVRRTLQVQSGTITSARCCVTVWNLTRLSIMSGFSSVWTSPKYSGDSKEVEPFSVWL